MARRITAAVTFGAAATLAFGAAAPMAAAGPASAALPADAGIAQLKAAAGDSVEARVAVGTVASAMRTKVAGTYAQFAYPAPTVGCGPLTFTAASGAGGAVGAEVGAGQIRFQASPAYTGVPKASGLSVAWLNVNTGANGIMPVDGMTDYQLPSLAKVVDTGPGNVVAAIWGTVAYPDATCHVAPTVGLFTVEAAPAPAPA
jgi:hypothetical protein